MGNLVRTISDGIVDFIKSFSFINLLGGVVFIILICLSLYYNVSLFYQLGSNQEEKLGFVLASLAIEGAKIFFLLKGALSYAKAKRDIEKLLEKNVIVPRSAKIIKRIPAIIMWILYAGFSVLSIFASYGYSLTALEKLKVEHQTVSQSISVTDHTNDITTLEGEVKDLQDENKAYIVEKTGIDANIKTLIDQGKSDFIPASSYTRKDSIDKTIAKNKDTIEKKKASIQQYKNEDSASKKTNSATITVVNARSTFQLLGSAFGIQEDQMKFTVMFWIAIMVELGIIALKPQAKLKGEILPIPVQIPIPIEYPKPEPVIAKKRVRKPVIKKKEIEPTKEKEIEDIVVIKDEPRDFVDKDGAVMLKVTASSDKTLTLNNEIVAPVQQKDSMTEKELEEMLKRAHELSIDVDNEKRSELVEAAQNYV